MIIYGFIPNYNGVSEVVYKILYKNVTKGYNNP